ncbi:hypothetical protein Q8A67_023273 [Cirrhinus molitorella]|uniref:Uncharacterized protein n=1 Tax=Cirrhinus molitorella TaxID=172907 RepID=A0AA88NZN6_9TELE|nr:hypothetical protein Q8A67_023273 [Cirrhinus molitorella]
MPEEMKEVTERDCGIQNEDRLEYSTRSQPSNGQRQRVSHAFRVKKCPRKTHKDKETKRHMAGLRSTVRQISCETEPLVSDGANSAAKRFQKKHHKHPSIPRQHAGISPGSAQADGHC